MQATDYNPSHEIACIYHLGVAILWRVRLRAQNHCFMGGKPMDENKIGKAEHNESQHRGPVPPDKAPAPLWKRFNMNDVHFTWGNGKPLASWTNVVLVLTKYDNNTATVSYGGTTTDQGWRGDVNPTVNLVLDSGEVIQVPLPVMHSFCGTGTATQSVGIDPSYFDRTVDVNVDLNAPYWLRC
jgi:hypothetical protein